jgi:hypothetical protein
MIMMGDCGGGPSQVFVPLQIGFFDVLIHLTSNCLQSREVIAKTKLQFAQEVSTIQTQADL